MKTFNQAEYDKENRIKITLFLSKKNDIDILSKIDFKNKQGSIKRLIRQGLKK